MYDAIADHHPIHDRNHTIAYARLDPHSSFVRRVSTAAASQTPMPYFSYPDTLTALTDPRRPRACPYPTEQGCAPHRPWWKIWNNSTRCRRTVLLRFPFAAVCSARTHGQAGAGKFNTTL